MLKEQSILETGISQYGVISPAEIVFSEEIRKICEGNVCRNYGTSWACPPAVGTVEQCRARCLRYGHAMAFCGVYPLEDAFDYEGMVAGHGAFKGACDKLFALAKGKCADLLLLSNEGCGRCKVCAYPTGACRMPEKLFPSLEGFGIDVTSLARSANIRYNNGANTVTYFGMLLY